MEINKCLEDPNTVYSDQYMPLALMPAVVEAIQNSGGLPSIESGDAGKVLTVNAGETGAEWASPSGGGGNEFLITASNFQYDEQLERDTFDSDKTFAQIEAEISSQTPKPIYLFDAVHTRAKIPCSEILYNERTGAFVGLNFYQITSMSSTAEEVNGQITYAEYIVQSTGNSYGNGYILCEALPAS